MKAPTRRLLAALELDGFAFERASSIDPRAQATARRALAARWREERERAHRTILAIGVSAIRGEDGFGDGAVHAPPADPRATWQRLRSR